MTAACESHVLTWRDWRYGQARRFLDQLDAEAEAFTFQTFDDTPAKRNSLARILHGDLDRVAADLDGFQQQRAGVFVTVSATDLKGRQAHNIKRVRAVFVDLDGAPLKPVLEAGLAPHIVCESSRGRFHAYWLTDDCPLDQFERVQRALARRFGGDPSVHDLPRVMRLPGFRHFKHDAQTCKLLDELGSNAPPYALAEIVGALKLELDAPEKEPAAKPKGDGNKIEPGNRHAHLFASGRSMARRGLSREAVRAALAAENQARCNPPLPEADIGYLAGRAFTAKDAQGWQADATESASAEHQSDAENAAAGDSDGWPEPLPLVATLTPEPYPLDALPDTIRKAVEEVQGFTKAPVSLVAASALASISLATQALFDVKRADGLTGPVSLFLLTIADSGERKSTCDGYFTLPHREYEKQQADAAKPDLQTHNADLAAWEAKKAAILNAIRGNKDITKSEQELRELEADKPQAPRVPKLLRADETPENLAFILVHQWPSGGIVSSEAGLVFGSHGMGRDSIMRNLTLYNVLWDGGEHSIGRRTSESFTVRGARLTVGLQVQEPTLREFFERSNGLARGTGFLARFLVAWPESTQGFRPFTDPPSSWPMLAAFNRRVSEILNTTVSLDDDGALTPAMLTLSPEAKAAWRAFHDAIEGELRTGGELFDVRDVASKAADNAARMAALFHVFERDTGAIGADSFEAASRIVAWHLNESRRFFGELALPAEMAGAVRLDAWLIDYCRRERTHILTTRTVQQFGPHGLRQRAAIEEAIRELEESGRARLKLAGRRREIRVNPALVDWDTP